MTRFAALAVLLSSVLLVLLASGVPTFLVDESSVCDGYASTRHRSGKQPRDLGEGLARRLCSYQAVATRFDEEGPPLLHDFVLIETDPMQLPAVVDSNSPAVWIGDTMVVFNSAWEASYLSSGSGAENLSEPITVELPQPERPGAVWLESVWLDQATAVLYGWYHFEPADLICLTAPLIGAAVSYDYGSTWEDRGFVLDTVYGIDCEYDNGYFVGGNGDFSVVRGANGRYFYFMYTTYAGPMEEQGVAVARSAVDDKGQPGTVYKYFSGTWTEPGLGGRQTILFGTSTGWRGPFVESFWGPSVHWNTFLESYVVLLNHTAGENWDQEGVYISFSRDMARWTEPQKILEVNDWYPQVLGLDPGESDTRAGKNARIYVGGISSYIIQFTN